MDSGISSTEIKGFVDSESYTSEFILEILWPLSILEIEKTVKQ